MRPIDADALINEWNKKAVKMSRDRDGALPVDFSLVISAVSKAPTITLDDLRPKGRWLPHPEDWREQMVGDQCSLCGFEYYGNRFAFCLNCGVDMKDGDSNA